MASDHMEKNMGEELEFQTASIQFKVNEHHRESNEASDGKRIDSIRLGPESCQKNPRKNP